MCVYVCVHACVCLIHIHSKSNQASSAASEAPFDTAVDMDQLESLMAATSPVALLDPSLPNLRDNVLIELHAIRCDVSPNAGKLLTLLNIADQLIARNSYRDGLEAGMFHEEHHG
jgi:hypothetical protein